MNRREFLKTSAATSTVLAYSPTKVLRDISLNSDWIEAIKEDNLREEVSELMKKTNFNVVYRQRESDLVNVQLIDYKKIVGFDMPVEKFHEIKGQLKDWEDFSKKHPGEGLVRIYDYQKSFIRDVSYIEHICA